MTLRLYGSTSGYTELAPPAVAPDGVLSLPTGVGTIAKEKQSATGRIGNAETSTSTSYTDLATVGPVVTITTGTKALVTVTALIDRSTTSDGYVSVAVSGASTVAASDNYALINRNVRTRSSVTFLLTGLTAGSNTFTLKYKTNGTSTEFSNREIVVIDMGS